MRMVEIITYVFATAVFLAVPFIGKGVFAFVAWRVVFFNVAASFVILV